MAITLMKSLKCLKTQLLMMMKFLHSLYENIQPQKSYVYNLESNPIIVSNPEDGWKIFAVINALALLILVFIPKLNKTIADLSFNKSTHMYFQYIWLLFFVPIAFSLLFWYKLLRFIIQNI
jgi:hypothetical protein